MKVTAGIFRKGDSVLLMRRARTEPYAGEWEYPGGKFEIGEDGPTCLHRELSEELGIDATIGKLVATAVYTTDSGKEIELFAYEIKNYRGDICLRVHDAMDWVAMDALTKHPQLPADLIVSKILVGH